MFDDRWTAPEYQKINAPYKRHTEGPDKGKFRPEFALPEFEYLLDNQWIWTEKIDGTNIRIGANGMSLDGFIGGRTNKANIDPQLHLILTEILGKLEAWWYENEESHESVITLYGEGYGAGIQKGAHYRPDKAFILFDVRINDWWLERENVVEIAETLGIEVVPGPMRWTLADMMEYVSETEIKSAMGENAQIEGVVGVPAVPLYDRRGNRIITKVKVKDFFGG